jgi:glycerophosphoryl diester phosphodiesterase
MKIIGHRGAKGLAPENTEASFEAAIAQGVDAIETDVRVTNDGFPVIVHNAHAKSRAGEKFKIAHVGHSHVQDSIDGLMTLEDAVRCVNRRVPLWLELKAGVPTDGIIVILKKLLEEGWQPKDFKFLSFDFKILKDLHEALPDIDIVVNEMWSGVRASYRARVLGTKEIDIFSRVLWTGFIRSVSKRGYKLYTFPLNDAKKARRWQKAGLAGVITDYPDRFKDLK